MSAVAADVLVLRGDPLAGDGRLIGDTGPAAQQEDAEPVLCAP